MIAPFRAGSHCISNSSTNCFTTFGLKSPKLTDCPKPILLPPIRKRFGSFQPLVGYCDSCVETLLYLIRQKKAKETKYLMLVLNDQICSHNRRNLIDPNWGFSSISRFSETFIALGTLEGILTFDDQEIVLKELGSGTIHIQPNEYLDHGYLYEQAGVVELFWLEEPKDWDSIKMVMSYRTSDSDCIVKHEVEVVDWLREGF